MKTNVQALIVPDSAASAGTNDIRPITPPVDLPGSYAWLVWLAVLLIAGLVAAWFWKRRRARARALTVAPPLPPHEKARKRLAEALASIEDAKTFCILVSDALRLYLEERFAIHAPERTTEEFLQELPSTSCLNPEQQETLGEFLNQCDLVKFARHEPTQTELRRLHSIATRLV
ncbi:MAG TPA: hypothetical protein P5055_23330, partial [Candidatus Paceibacterota bacterium]|nr:hypothetical protein [Candidatus Paceibacterota bacterium]